MIKRLVKVRRFNKESYSIYLRSPMFEGEKGCLGLDITPYFEVTTPENDFGYPDHILFNNVKGTLQGYTMHRYLPNWIMSRIDKAVNALNDDIDNLVQLSTDILEYSMNRIGVDYYNIRALDGLTIEYKNKCYNIYVDCNNNVEIMEV